MRRAASHTWLLVSPPPALRAKVWWSAVFCSVLLVGVGPALAQSTDAGAASKPGAPAQTGNAEPGEAPATAEPAPEQPLEQPAPAQAPNEAPAEAPQQPVAPAPLPDPPHLVPDHAITPPRMPLPAPAVAEPHEQDPSPALREPTGPAQPTRIETEDGVTLLSNRQPGNTAEQAPAPAPADVNLEPAASPASPDSEAAEHAVLNVAEAFTVQRPRAKREPAEQSGGLGWMWAPVLALAVLLVPIGLLLNRGARRSLPPPRSREGGPTSVAPGSQAPLSQTPPRSTRP